jgi:hypothetical protein
MATIYRMSADDESKSNEYGEPVGDSWNKVGLRVRSRDYGKGTIVGLSYSGVTIHWDDELTGTHVHVLDHARHFVEELERLE